MTGRCIAALACLALTGCGEEPRLETATADLLRRDVASVRAAAEQGDRQEALAALDRLERRIGRAEGDGRLSGEDAAALLQGVERARARAEQELPEPTAEPPEATPQPTPEATTEPTPEPTPIPDEEGDEDDEGPGKGKGKAKGHDKEKGGD